MLTTQSERPTARATTARPWNPQPGRLDPRVIAQRDSAKLRELQSDWLFRTVGPDAQRRLLVEHGLLHR